MFVRCRIFTVLLATFAFNCVSFGPVWAEECKLVRRWSANAIEDRSGRLLIPYDFSGRSYNFVLDTGATSGTFFQDAVTALGLQTHKANERLVGISGFSTDKVVPDIVPSNATPAPGFDRALIIRDEYFVVDRPPEADPRGVGTLGASVFAGADLELDFASRKVALYSPNHCPGQVVYWAPDYLVMPMKLDDYNRATITVTLDGKPLRALIDTGATESVLSLDAADHFFDISPASAGVEKAGVVRDIRAKPLESYRRQFSKLDVGGITFNNTWLQLTDVIPNLGADMILGMYHLRKMHLYLASKEEKLYATVAAAGVDEPIDPLGSVDWQRCLTPGGRDVEIAVSGCTTIINAATEPRSHLAIAYAQRGAAYARKGDKASAGRDFEEAFHIDPDLPDPRIIRAVSLAEQGDNSAALREFDIVLKSFPNRIDALVGRAGAELATGAYGPAAKDLRQAFDKNWSFSRTTAGANGTARLLYDRMLKMASDISAAQPGLADAHIVQADVFVAEGNRDRAIPELDLAIAADPASTDAYLRRSARYQERGDVEHALTDLDRVIGLNPESPEMLNRRCWARATMGRLDDALADCDAALKLRPSPHAYDSRGFVYLKTGRYALAIDDYTAALQLDPKLASSLYGRGQARKAAGDAAGGGADIAAGRQLQSDIEQRFGK